MNLIKKKIKGFLKNIVKRTYQWIMESGSPASGSGNQHSTEKISIFTNDIKFNIAAHDMLDDESKRIIVSHMYYNKAGFYPNIKNPKKFSEKALWLKLFYKNPTITTCCDKYYAKDYIDNILGPGYTVPVLKRYDNVCDIDLDELPEKFVLKVNWCTGYNIIVTDKSLVDLEDVKAKLDLWCLPLKSSYYGSFNWGYKDMKPVVFAEEYLDLANNTTEYKLFCFNGNVNFILVELDFFGKSPKRGYYDKDWNEQPFYFANSKKASDVKRPETLEKMVEIAEKLAEPFPYVRIDFYDIDGKLYVGEMTFYSGGGFTKVLPKEWDDKLGEQLNIDSLIQNYNK